MLLTKNLGENSLTGKHCQYPCLNRYNYYYIVCIFTLAARNRIEMTMYLFITQIFVFLDLVPHQNCKGYMVMFPALTDGGRPQVPLRAQADTDVP